ncbi:MAG TPA: hypothetical protein VM553_14985 [Dongiaceae bacterium]|nr:hypothetical protein [Dongiaceae bacterium]
MMLDQFWMGVVIASVLSGTLLFLLVLLQRTRRTQLLLEEEKKVLEARIRNLENRIELLDTSSKGIGQRLMVAEKKLNLTMERQDDLASNNSDQLLRRQADRLLKGRSLPEETEAVSRSEAKLMALVGGKPQEKS